MTTKTGPKTWILVAGTGAHTIPRDQQLAAQAVGRALAKRGFGLVTCGWIGVDKEVTLAFAETLQAMGVPLSQSLQQIVPRPNQPTFFGGEVIYVDEGPQEWVESVRRTQAVILIGGQGGTYGTYEIARRDLIPAFPIPSTGADARVAFDEILKEWGNQPTYRHLRRDELVSLDRAIDSRESAEAVVDRLFDLMVQELSGRHSPHASRPLSARPSMRPGKNQRMDFLFVTALPEERDALLRKLPAYEKVPARKDDVHVYFRADLALEDGDDAYRVSVLPLLGMGRVNAATATADAIKRWRPRHVVLVGTAGGVAERKVSVGDVLISEQVVDYEMTKITEKGVEVRWSVHKASRRLYAAALNLLGDTWTTRIEERRPTPGKPRLHLGPIASGDKVIAAANVLAEYRSVWPALIGVEMEAAGVASACFSAARPPEFFMIRGVSDLADARKGSSEVEAGRFYACDVAATYAIELLRSRPIPTARASSTNDQ